MQPALLIVFAAAVKLAMLRAYTSTDFEVHRNWMAITHNLPVAQWYYEHTSQWTLDYPPLFAYFEWVLSWPAAYFDPSSVAISQAAVFTPALLYFQRVSVLLSESSLWLAWKYAADCRLSSVSNLAFVLFSPCLVIVDYIHFQYNGLMLGLLVLSIAMMQRGNYVASCAVFTVLLGFKHIFLYMAPGFLAFLLYNVIFLPRGINFAAVWKLFLTGSALMLLIFFPFLSHMPQVLSRLFPFSRGLTHAYWAPNVWAIYNSIDGLLSYILYGKFTTEYMQGLVQVNSHSVLPNITPGVSLLLVLLAATFCLFANRRRPICDQACLSCFCFFLFGWQVHEKTILTILVPLLCLSSLGEKRLFLLCLVANFSLIPLVQSWPEQWFIVPYSVCVGVVQGKSLTERLNRVEITYILVGGVALVVYYALRWLYPLLFLPLLLISTYSAIGVVYSFCLYATPQNKAKQD